MALEMARGMALGMALGKIPARTGNFAQRSNLHNQMSAHTSDLLSPRTARALWLDRPITTAADLQPDASMFLFAAAIYGCTKASLQYHFLYPACDLEQALRLMLKQLWLARRVSAGLVLAVVV